MKVALAQLNPIIGDIEGNLARIVEVLQECGKYRPDLVVFTELFLVGYPPRDLLENHSFIGKTREALDRLREWSRKWPATGILLGTPWPSEVAVGKGLHNSALLLYQGRIVFCQHKALLPTYDVFDEARYFDASRESEVISFKDETLGISICEDAWNDPVLWKRCPYDYDPITALADKGATIIVNIAASPFHRGKETIRYEIARSHACRHGIPFVFVNQVGANDELIFDGRSLCVDGAGRVIAVLPSFEEKVEIVSLEPAESAGRYQPEEEIATVYKALVLGICDYMRKCGFRKAILGLSGGIDSAVTCCLATEALGRENVIAVSMPGPYSSRGSMVDAAKLARNLGIALKTVPITSIYQAYLASLQEHFQEKEADITEENIQARIRGNVLMALSNKFGYLVLSTGNKSELAVGYCTLYGDMSGGLSVISDVPKTMVYELAAFINRHSEVIPEEILRKPPSAELRQDQTDQDTLPPYDLLDAVLHYYVDEGYSLEEIVALNFDRETVHWIIRSVDRNEYKRRQSPPGLKVTSKAFGMGRRMPIAARFNAM
ncbi:MAG: NAD+ synthase [Deltaproteobacteria bacterium]|nr:NAD+ synthase [Deltaproteobacteria bacterium]MBW2072125.1 NAD+ synthase [Deltaproteobacteria bacterium]